MKYVLDASVAINWVIVEPDSNKAARLRDVFDISIQTRHNFYDCLYVALAERERCELLTADAKLVTNLQPTFPFITSLATLP
jgi:predicted nucleic acid-binding protein